MTWESPRLRVSRLRSFLPFRVPSLPALIAIGILTMFAIVAIVLAPCFFTAAAEEPESPAAYDDADAYEIYSLLIPHEESYEFGKGTLVFRGETVAGPEDVTKCVAAKQAARFKEALADFKLLNKKKWLLQRQFEIERPYEIVSADEIDTAFRGDVEGDWETFNARHPDSGGFFVMSAVGFNRDKTLAVVYSGSTCGGLCGRWSLHLLEKVDGTWKVASGVTCATMS